MTYDNRLIRPEFPRSNAYHPDWVIANASGGANSLWLTEWLASALALKSETCVLDLGCGAAASSIFLAREYGARVWATDLWHSASENLKRIRHAEAGQSVFPIHTDARSLPFAGEFFDAIVSIDAYPYFGTDDFYLSYLARFVKPGGTIAIAGAGLTQEIDREVPEHLDEWWSAEPGLWCLHSPAWWRRHWEKSGLVDVELADSMPAGWKHWLDWHLTIAPDNHVEINAVRADQGQFLGYSRVVARRRLDVQIPEPVVSVPSEFVEQPLLRKQV